MGSIRVTPVESGPLWAIGSDYFSKKLVEHAKSVPGVHFERSLMAWLGYPDAIAAVVARLAHAGIRVDDAGLLPDPDSWKTALTPFLYATAGLREYQIEGVKFLLARGREGALLADGMRLGKSAQATTAARAWKQKTLVVCPSHGVGVWGREPKAIEGPGEIAKWWPDAWKAPHEVVCLETVAPAKAGADEIVRHVEKLAHAQVIVCHYEILYAWEKVLLAWGVKTFIIDECFPAGTKVETPDGPRNIEDIHPGDAVINALGIGRVRRRAVRRAQVEDCLLVSTERGREFIVTRRHPILTRAGWRTAESLCPGLELIDIALTHMLASYHEKVAVGPSESSSQMPVLQEDENDLGSEERLLLAILRHEIEVDASSISKAADGFSYELRVSQGNASAHKKYAQAASGVRATVQRKDENEKSSANAWGDEANHRSQPHAGRSLAASCPWGQRETAPASRARVESNVESFVDPAALDSIGRRAAPVRLCSRHGAPKKEDNSRSRRQQSLRAEASSFRSKTRHAPDGDRVARVTVPKQADFERLGLSSSENQGSLWVYNLEVSGHPSYAIVGGLVVHNCHILAGYKSRRLAAIKNIARAASRVIGLSGTPVVGEPRKLHNILNVLADNRMGFFFLPEKDGKPRASYANVFCAARQEAVGKGETAKLVWKFDGKSNLDAPDGKWCLTQEETLAARMKYLMLRRLKRDVDPQLPEKQRQIIDVSIPARQTITPTRGLLGAGAGELRRILDLAADGKLKHVVEVLRGHIDEGEKAICFCYRRLFAERVANDVSKKAAPEALVEFTHGGLTPKERDKRIHRVREHDGPALLVCTIDTTSTVIDLSFAGVSVFAELVYEGHDLAQCEERVYKFGKGTKALIQYIIARGTGDELILRAVINKLDTFEKVIGATGDGMKEDLGKKKENPLKRLYEALAAMQKAKA